MRRYVFKTTLDNKELEAKIEKGGKVFEIQLYEDFVENSFSIIEAFNNFNKENIDIITVHAPISNFIDNGTIYLESITCDFFKSLFFKTCEFAQLFANYYKHPVNVIIHNGFRLDNYLMIPSLEKEIINIMNYVIDNYPDLYIQIENTVPFSSCYSKVPFFCSGIFYENIEIVKYLNEKCKKPIFTTVFDVCHYLTSIRILKKINNKEISLESLFKAHEKSIGTIHFSNLRNLGLEKGEHGCGYENTLEDISLLKELLRLIDKYASSALFCLEISEVDYFEIKNLLRTIDLINKIDNGEI